MDGRYALRPSDLGKTQVYDLVSQLRQGLRGKQVEPSPPLSVLLEDVPFLENVQAAAPGLHGPAILQGPSEVEATARDF